MDNKITENTNGAVAPSSSPNVKDQAPALAGCLHPLVRSQELVDVYKITCIDGDYKEIAEVSIRKEYINREDALEIALNILVDEINKNPLSLVGKAFRVRSDKLGNTIKSK